MIYDFNMLAVQLCVV